ncbi:MAG: hypothetical protein ACUVTH_03185 [Thermogutta sp.]
MAGFRNRQAHDCGTAWSGWASWLVCLLFWVGLHPVGLSQLREGPDPRRLPSIPGVSVSESASDDVPLRFRRVFVPQELLEQVRDPVPYFPLNAAEFEKMLAATNRQVFFRGQNGRIVTAIYRANIRDNDLIGLEGEWFIELVNGASAIIPLGKLTIGLSDPVWVDLGGSQVSLLTDQDGNVSLYAERSGKVGFRWSARGQAVGGTGAVRFDLTLPTAIRNEVELYTSDRFEVTAEGALIFPMRSSSGGWLGHRLVVADQSRLKLILHPTRRQTQLVPHGDYREEIAYELTIQGLEATWQWSLDALDSPLDALTIRVPAHFRVVEVSLGDVALSWEYQKEDNSPTQTVRVQFPEPLMGRNRHIQLRGIAAITLDKAFVLPQLRLDQLFWRSAAATVVVRAPLAIHNLNLRSARLKDVSSLLTGSRGTVLEVIHDSPAAETEILCQIEPFKIQQTAVATAIIGDSEVQAKVRLAVQPEGSNCFDLVWPIAPEWSISSVTAANDSLLDDWEIQDDLTSTASPGQKVLVVRLKKALPSEMASLFTITARRDSPDWQQSVFLDELIPLAVPSWPADGHLYASLVLDPALASFNTLELEPDIEPVSTAEINTLRHFQETGSPNLMFEITELTVRPRIRLIPKQVRYQAHIKGIIQVDGANLLQSFQMTVEPDQTPMGEFCVFWSEQQERDEFEWHLVEADGRKTPLEIIAQSFGPCGVVNGSVVRLPRLIQESFVVMARKRSPLRVGPVPLPLFPKAIHYEAEIYILGSPGEETEVNTVGHWRTSGMQLLDRATLACQPGQPIVAAYRYQGVSNTGAQNLPQLELAATEAIAPAGTWADRGTVALRLDASGLLERWHVFEIGGHCEDRLVLHRSPEEPFPEEMIVLIDDRQTPYQTGEDERGQRIIIQVGRRQQPQRVTVWERFAQPSLFMVSVLRVRKLEPEFPVRKWRTTVWLPPVHSALKLANLSNWGVFLSDWTVRLFGPLKRPPDQPLFLPDRINRIIFDPSTPPANLSIRRAIQFQEELGKQLEKIWERNGASSAVTDEVVQKTGIFSAATAPAASEAASSATSVQRDSRVGTKVIETTLWRDLLSDEFLDRVHNLPPGSRAVAFLVDLESLADLGIQPRSEVTWSRQEGSNQVLEPLLKAEKFLNQHGLALAITQNNVVLTSIATIATHQMEIQWAKPPVYKLDPHSQWWREIENAVVAGDGTRYCRIRLWNDLPPELKRSGKTVSDPSLMFAVQGWNATSLGAHDFERSDYVTLIIIRQGILEATRWLGLLLAFVLAWLRSLRRRLRIFTNILAFAVIALFVPPPFVPLISGCFLGSILAFAASLLVTSHVGEKGQRDARRGVAPVPSDEEKGTSPSLNSKSYTVGIFLALFLLLSTTGSYGGATDWELSASASGASSPASAKLPEQPLPQARPQGQQEKIYLLAAQVSQLATRESSPGPGPNNAATSPASTQPWGSPPPYRVFIPVDESGKPVGQEVYVPEGLYKELQKRSSPVSARPTGWHFLSATYRGTLAATPTAERWELTQLTANFECWIADAPVQIEIPLGSSEAVPQISDILLDGQPIPATWDQSRLRVTVLEGGRRRLQVPIALSPRTDAGTNEVRLQIPPVANARLELAAPFAVNRVEVPSALGRVESDPESGRWTAELGAVSELVIRWPTSNDPLADAGPQADLLYRLRLTPTDAIWELRWKFHLNNARIDQLQMSLDPNLRLERISSDGQVQIEELATEGDCRLFQLRFDSALKDEAILVGTFGEPLVAGSGGIRLPKAQLLGMRIARCDLLIDDHPGFDLLVDNAVGWKSVDPPLQSKRWAIPIGKGEQAYEYLGSPIFWGAWVQTQPTVPTMDEQVQLLATQNEILMRWQARLSTSGGLPGCYRVQVPPGFVVRKVAVVTGAAEQTQPWSVAEENTLLILLADRIGPESQLVIEGRLPRGPQEEWRFQRPSIQECHVQSLTVTLFRAPDVFVEITKQVGLEVVSSVPQPLTNQQPGVFLGALAARPVEEVDLVLKIQPNQPSITAEEWIRLIQADDAVQAEIRLNLTVTAGLLEELKLEWPPDWQMSNNANEKTLIQPPLKAEWTLTNGIPPGYEPGSTKKRLIFASPQKGRTSVFLSALGSVDEQGRVGIPVIRLPNVTDSRCYLLMPKALDWAPNVAQRYGLRRVPDRELVPLGAKADEVCYELKQTEILPPITCVPSKLADWDHAELRIHVSAEGGVLGVMTVWLRGGGPQGLQIQMPSGVRPLTAWLDDRAVPVYEFADGTTYVATDDLKDHRLDLLFSGSLIKEGQRLTLECPRLGGDQIQNSGHVFLMLQANADWIPAIASGDPLTAWDYHLTQARRAAEKLLQIWKAPETSVVEAGSGRQFVNQYLLARGEARRALLLAPQTATVSAAEIRLHNLDLQVNDILKTSADEEAALASPGAAVTEGFRSAASPDTQCWYFECEGFPAQISLQKRGTTQAWRDLPIGLAMVLTSAGLAWLIRQIRGQLSVWMMRFAHPVVVLVGIAWWIWLRPGFVGWLMIIAAIGLLIRSRWQWVPKEEATVPMIVHQKLPPTTNPK